MKRNLITGIRFARWHSVLVFMGLYDWRAPCMDKIARLDEFIQADSLGLVGEN